MPGAPGGESSAAPVHVGKAAAEARGERRRAGARARCGPLECIDSRAHHSVQLHSSGMYVCAPYVALHATQHKPRIPTSGKKRAHLLLLPRCRSLAGLPLL